MIPMEAMPQVKSESQEGDVQWEVQIYEHLLCKGWQGKMVTSARLESLETHGESIDLLHASRPPAICRLLNKAP